MRRQRALSFCAMICCRHCFALRRAAAAHADEAAAADRFCRHRYAACYADIDHVMFTVLRTMFAALIFYNV